MRFSNTTECQAIAFRSRTLTGAPSVTCLAKRTYTILPNGDLRENPSLCTWQLADSYYGAEGKSSLRSETDFIPTKPAAELVLVDLVAYAPQGRPSTAWDARIQFEELDERLLVTGPRQAKWRRGALSIGGIEPTSTVPVRHELAYGGTSITPDGSTVFRRNPVGRAFQFERDHDPNSGVWLPQVGCDEEFVEKPLKIPNRSCPMPIARAWTPRLERAGTFDDKWHLERWPLLPEDLDERFWMSSPLCLDKGRYLAGGESIRMENLTAAGVLECRIPQSAPLVSLARTWGGTENAAVLRLDTVVIDTGAMLMHLSWRGRFECDGDECEVALVAL